MRLVLLADTHSLHTGVQVPYGDILIHAGDFCNTGTLYDVISFNTWLGTLPHPHKLVIAGNHDMYMERNPMGRTLLFNCTYLEDTGTTINGINFYGSPWQPFFCNWAFNIHEYGDRYRKFSQIPEDTNILITHCPPFGVRDTSSEGNQIGCRALLKRVNELKNLNNLRLHVFGHNHAGYGEGTYEDIIFCNSSICNEAYQPIHTPIVVDI